MAIKFGAAGNSDSFYEQGNKSSLKMPAWLAEMGLTAYEYQCSRGVRIKEDFARRLGEEARANNITLSIHAPYYINLSTEDPQIKEKTKGHILKSLRAALWMGATTVVLHPGGTGKDREASYRRAKSTLAEVLKEAAEEGLGHIKVAPETMGKVNQMGSLDEILDLCTVADNVVPCVDFGHLHAVTQGSLTDKESFAGVLDKISAVLGEQALKNLHIHFSPIEFTKGGEKKHRTTLETDFGPHFTPLAELIIERNMEPVIICESSGRQAEDALVYKRIYDEIKRKR
ncbi:deoxyribonuclease-4 [Desulfohalotomaculum tongense]|uniref:TIM barrel protein n=1 Tax=Desulforadius tongensis TaxID=1216062 RepID=UPI001959E9C1|nr:TIM barrel protein [Desulforadius tongensis]MBM7855671.1 deoxyribonuclease-4 [Desulforadius tongensis]